MNVLTDAVKIEILVEIDCDTEKNNNIIDGAQGKIRTEE